MLYSMVSSFSYIFQSKSALKKPTEEEDAQKQKKKKKKKTHRV
jgi:hypothetical protein